MRQLVGAAENRTAVKPVALNQGGQRRPPRRDAGRAIHTRFGNRHTGFGLEPLGKGLTAAARAFIRRGHGRRLPVPGFEHEIGHTLCSPGMAEPDAQINRRVGHVPDLDHRDTGAQQLPP